MSENDVVCESFTFIFIEFLLVSENKDNLQVYFDNCTYRIVAKQMIDDKLFWWQSF